MAVCGGMQRPRVEQRRPDFGGPYPDRLPVPLIFRSCFRDTHERALGDAQSTLVELAWEDTVFTGCERLRDLVTLTSVSRVIRLRPV